MKCSFCEKEFKTISGLQSHISQVHKEVTLQEYFVRFLGKEKTCFDCGKEVYFLNLKKGFSEVCIDCKAVRLHKRKSEVFKKVNQDYGKQMSNMCPEFWIRKGFTENEAKKKVSEIQKANGKKHTAKGELHLRESSVRCKEYWLKKGFSEEDAKQKVTLAQTQFSKEICIEKYGEEGLRIWRDRQNRWQETMNSKSEEEKIDILKRKLINFSGVSKISQELFLQLECISPKIYFSAKNKEFILYDKKDKKAYMLDYCNSATSKCIEFQGDFWHANPSRFSPNEKIDIVKLKAEEVWEADYRKYKAISKKFKVLYVWESEYLKDPETTIQKCQRFLEEK